jgi:hypothetical protein
MSRPAQALSMVSLTLVAGCTSVLGLDAPTLDPCVLKACGDATTDAADTGAVPDAHDAGAEAAPSCVWDGAVPDGSGTGIRCGGGCAPVVYCTGATPVCCQSVDAGLTTFACTASEGTCAGYSIDCVNENDCAGSDVCCHYSGHMVCAASCTSSADIACVPGSAQDCPEGKACDVPLVNEGVAVPYYACQP